MSSTTTRGFAFAAGLVLALGFTASLGAAEPEKVEVQKPCCLVHDGYQGICKVTPGKDESCASILEYLNTPGTVGKSYCGGNKLRGGWKSADCDKPAEN